MNPKNYNGTILKNNSQPSSNRNSTASHHPSKHRQNHHPSSSHRKTSHSYNKSSFNPYSTQTNWHPLFNRHQLNIRSEKSIYKVGDRVFLFDNLNNIDENLVKNIININDKGSKFIPCLHFNHFHIFKNLLNNFDSALPLFNRNYIFHINSLPSVDYSNDNISLNISNNLFSECDSLKCFLQKIKYKSKSIFLKLDIYLSLKFFVSVVIININWMEITTWIELDDFCECSNITE